jgi:serine phosphatase RsbU (regulator of sigma subunit)
LAARELAALIDILRELNAALDPTERLPHVVQRAARAVEAEAGSLFLLAGDPPLLVARVLHQRAEGELSALAAPLVIAPGEGTAGWVALHGQSLNLPDVAGDPRFKPYDHPAAGEIRSLVSVPLRADGRVLGVIDLVNRPGGFDADAEAFLCGVADELAIALRNHTLVQSLEKEKLALEVMREVSHTLLSTLEVEEVLKRIVVGLGRLITFDAVGIFLVREDGSIEHAIERGYGTDRLDRLRQKVGEGLIGWSISTAEPVIVPDVKVDGRYIAARDSTQSEMVAPLISRGKVIGAFNLESDKLAAYSREDLKRLSAFADSAAVALEVARLHEAAVRSRRLEEDLTIARQIQLSFLPQARPKHKGIDLAGLNVPSLEVGGDYYDFIDVAPGQIGVTIADVAGKGISAGLIMASFRASLRAEVRNNYSISTILAKVNRLMIESTEPSRFVTALYGVLDLATRRFTYSCAGHYPGILVHEDGAIQELSDGGTVLGAFPTTRYEEAFTVFAPGDMLLLYTDGVTEAVNSEGEEFGVGRLVDLAVTARGRSAAKIAAAVERAVRNFSKRKVPGDDLTLVVLKVTA